MASCVIERLQLSRKPGRQKSVNDGHSYPLKNVGLCQPSSCKIPSKTVRGFSDSSGNDKGGSFRDDDLWEKMQEEAKSNSSQEPLLSRYYQNSILSHDSLESALANQLSDKLGSSSLCGEALCGLFGGVFSEDKEIMECVKEDLRAAKERDPACIGYLHCFLNFKGFLACQAHRVAHKLWSHGKRSLAVVIQSRVSEVFAVDIHPAARIGRGILIDPATGVVIGETAVVGNNVCILHNVTLGGTGKASGDRHPKIGHGVLIGAGTCVLGNVRVGDGAKIGAGSIVLKDVPPRTTAVGNPARLVGGTVPAECPGNVIHENRVTRH
ncbi:hypothetical protein SAY87_031657 [Trapa incisa]|uniref:serine O-acetyltransferase n=1 Tax=Trapa incisa TaxID=236973 RepID=A0AAN7QQ13_9MYRT|nr:hypothetical protein SAY87_031657 [Trapa incisa]